MQRSWLVVPWVLALSLGIAAPALAAPKASQADINQLCGAWKELGLEPTAMRVELSAAVASYESGFGRGWVRNGTVSNNWGATHRALPTCPDGTKSSRCSYGLRPTCPGGTFLHPDSDAKGPYFACFYEYQTAREGALHFLKVLTQRVPCRESDGALSVLEALDSGDSYLLAEALWATCYFTTHVGAPDAETRITEYADALERHRAARQCPLWILLPRPQTERKID